MSLLVLLRMRSRSDLWLRRFALSGACLLGTLGAAHASDPVGTYVVPTRVDLLPNDTTPTQVAIHGAFFQISANGSATYGAPTCGMMYFACKAGDETLCRMQWSEIGQRVTPTPTTCAGFGALNSVPSAHIRQEGSALTSPDDWDLGIGIAIGVYVDGKCDPARALKCPLALGDAGVDAPTSTGTGGKTGQDAATGATGGASVGTGGSGAGGSASGGSGAGGSASGGSATGGSASGGSGTSGTGTGGKAGGTGGSGTKPVSSNGGGCSVATGLGAAGTDWLSFAMGGAIAGWWVGRRRRG